MIAVDMLSTLAAINIGITPPAQGINPDTAVGTVLSSALTIIFVIAAILVLFMLIIGAFQWITSGGDKEAVGKARQRITHALIGLAILALAFLIVTVVGQILNINIFKINTIPTLEGK
ncbi:hypothetical protein HY385_01435 [Candidatus Daviesbacteria bacterium]|nr:hypothetical protein [Candidatus Daviesbacteria bacterium]